ncbi:MAG: helicase-associated domain-containing protein [Chloroflexi bacterium]|nr:helicase-associated domain-containing protein [Chloroflexota bacterium]
MAIKRMFDYLTKQPFDQAAMNKEIAALLDSYNSNTLWEMARAAQLPNTTGKKLPKSELLALMAQEFFKPERIEAAYQKLTKTERDVLNRLLLHNGKVSSRVLARELIRAGLATEAPPAPEPKKQDYWYTRGRSIYGSIVPHIGSANNAKSTIFEDVMARLTLHGLLFSDGTEYATSGANYKLQLHPGDTLYVPAFVRRCLPEPQPIPVEVNQWQPAHVLHGDPQLFLRDLYLYWDTVRRHPIDMIQSGLVGKRGLKQLNSVLLTPDPTLDSVKQEDETSRLYLLRQILEELKLVKSQNGSLTTNVKSGHAVPDFWQKTTVEQVTAVLAAWRNIRLPFRFTNRQTLYEYGANPRQACQLLLQVLAELPANTWNEPDEVLDRLQERNSGFLFALRQQLTGRQSYYYGNRAQAMTEMDKLEQMFVAEATANFLLQLGLVELGFNNPLANPVKWHAYRLTALGTAVLRSTPLPNDAALTGQVIIQPNFQILAMGPVPLNVLAQLDLFAERQKVDRGAFEYHLSRQSVYAAQQMGYSVAEVQRFLETASPNDLPQNIRRSLDEWAAHHDRIVFRRNVTLLQAADETLLERLLNEGETGKLLARPVGNQVALVKSKQQARLVSALQEIGLLPAVSGANPEAADKSVVVGEDGRIQPVHAVPSLHLHGRLARFAIKTEDGWQLTAQSVGRAGGSKKKAQSIVDELGKLNRGRLPKSLVAQIRAWGGYYGSATVGTMTLFEFRDQETLAELRELPELKELLQPFAAGDRALAVVAGGQVTAVQAILARLGVKVVAH